MIQEVRELSKIQKFLEKRNLMKQYLKAKKYILDGNEKVVDFKIREPKILWIVYFRINKQFRAFARRDWDTITIFSIDNHQN